MTLLAVEPVRLAAWSGVGALSFENVCHAPGCTERPTEGHHVIRRSYGYGDSVVLLVDGVPVICWIPVCKTHHDQLTGLVGGHRAALVMPHQEGIERGLYRRWWVWYAALPMPSGTVPLPPRVLKSGTVLQPQDYCKEVSPA